MFLRRVIQEGKCKRNKRDNMNMNVRVREEIVLEYLGRKCSGRRTACDKIQRKVSKIWLIQESEYSSGQLSRLRNRVCSLPTDILSDYLCITETGLLKSLPLLCFCVPLDVGINPFSSLGEARSWEFPPNCLALCYGVGFMVRECLGLS